MNIMKKYYHDACCILKDFLPFIPELQLTNAKTYCGRIELRNGKQIIRLSKWNHVDALWLMDDEDHIEIIDTICHELAHTIEMKHCKWHDEVTQAFKKVVVNRLEKLERGVAV
jgi:hypothetical protein